MNVHIDQRIECYGAPIETAEAVAIVMHGRAQNPEWMREFLIDRLESSALDTVAFVAPEAADNTWYPGGFMQEFEANEPNLSFALERVDQLITQLVADGRARSDLHLLGFSQGACLLAEYIIRHPQRYGGVALLTGGAIGPPGTTWPGGSLDGTPTVMGTSDIDEWVPLARAEETRDLLEARGAAVNWKVYPGMDHIINDDEVRLVANLLRSTTP